MEWSDVRIFLAIARSGTLGGAARSLQTSHPTVGRRLRALEQAIGHTLFQRTADGLILTEEGHGIVALAEQMEEGALAMERRLAGQEQNLKGNLRISSTDWFGAYVLPPILADFSKAYPNVDVEILTGTRRFSLAQREAEVAFRAVPFDTADVIQRRLFRLEYGVYIAEEAADPKYGDGTGFRLITPSTPHFPTSRGSSRVSPTQDRSCDRTTATSRGACAGKGSALLSCRVWSAIRSQVFADWNCRRRPRHETFGWDTTGTCGVSSVFARSSRRYRTISRTHDVRPGNDSRFPEKRQDR